MGLQEHSRLDGSARLAALAETGLLDRAAQDVLNRFTRIAVMSVGAPVALVSLVDARRQFFASQCGLPEPWATQRQTPLSHSFCQLVVTSGTALVVEDARSDARVADNPAIRDLGVLAYAGKPICTPDEHVLGSFCVIDSKPRAWTTNDLALLDELAAAVSSEIDLCRRAFRAETSERELAELNAQLASEAERSAFACRQALHDLRTPLGTIALGLEGLCRHHGLSSYPQVARTLERMQRNAQHALALASGIARRQVSDDEAGLSDLAALVRDTCEDLGRPWCTIEQVLPDAPVWVAARPEELRRCVENLLSNALRFAQERIRMTLECKDSEVALRVEDDGPGLPSPAARERVWVRDVRFHAESGRSGSGLGLSIVRDMVEQAGGHVHATPSDIGGACFILYFPQQSA